MMSAFLFDPDETSSGSYQDENSSISDESDAEEFYDSHIDDFGSIAAGGPNLDIIEQASIDEMRSLDPTEANTSPPISPYSSRL